jgi:hypothetical protein
VVVLCIKINDAMLVGLKLGVCLPVISGIVILLGLQRDLLGGSQAHDTDMNPLVNASSQRGDRNSGVFSRRTVRCCAYAHARSFDKSYTRNPCAVCEAHFAYGAVCARGELAYT